MKKLARRGMNNKGFSLIELVIVVAIMAALIAILAPQYLKYVEKSRVTADEAMADELLRAIQVAASDPDITIASGAAVAWAEDGSLKITGDTENVLEAALEESLGIAITPTGVAGEVAKVKSTKYKAKDPYTVTYTNDGAGTSASIKGVWAS
ncbi:MAG: type IV pilin protein [Oscillospiraceae bacterium]